MWNKKGMEPATMIMIVIAIIAGLFVANEVGLFAVYNPSTPDSSLNSFINPYYFDSAVSSPTFSCALNPISFRADNSDYSSGWLAVDITGDGNLDTFTLNSVVTDPVLGNAVQGAGNVFVNGNNVYVLYRTREVAIGWDICSRDSGGITVTRSQACGPCTGTHTTPHRACQYKTVYDYYLYTPGAAPAEATSAAPVAGTLEVYNSGTAYIKTSKYACRDGNVVLQACSQYGDFQTLQTCSLGCQFLANQAFGSYAGKDIVKCVGEYQPSKNICSAVNNKLLFKTSASGSLLPTESCPYLCTNGACVQCKSGATRCIGQSDATIQTCQNNVWVNTNTCTGTGFFCTTTTGATSDDTTASCTSSIPDGTEECRGTGNKQPMKYNLATRTWENKGSACRTTCSVDSYNSAVCTNECTTNSCEFGSLFSCDVSATGNKVVPLNKQCLSGKCSVDNKGCTNYYEVGKYYCSGKDILKAVSDDADITLGGVKLNSVVSTTCGLDCLQTVTAGKPMGDATCKKASECVGKNANEEVCVAGSITLIGQCSPSLDQVVNQQTCAAKTGLAASTCDVLTNSCTTPTLECNGEFACKGDRMYTCSNHFFGSEIPNSCNNKGCFVSVAGSTPSDENSQCNNAVDYVSSLNSCSGTNSMIFKEMTVQDADNKQYLLDKTTACGNLGCDSISGLCKTECTVAEQKICGGDSVYSCTSDLSRATNPDYSCNGKGCNEGVCNSEAASIEGKYQCQGKDSFLGIKNVTSNQYYYIPSQSCGSEGCDSSTGQCRTSCKVGQGFTCLGGSLGSVYNCTTEGYLGALVETCGISGSYCSSNVGYCKSCELNTLTCGTNQLLKCADERTGQKTVMATCEAGCSIQSGQFKCDQLETTVTSAQNFLIDKDVIITITIAGSDSGKGIATSSTATLTPDGGGAIDSKSANSGSNGLLSLNFGKKPLGTYTAAVNLPSFGRAIPIEVTVTNDYTINLYGQNVIIAVPGGESKTQIESLDANGNAPDSLIVTDSPSGITVTATPTSIKGRWDLIATGTAGKYSVGLSAVKDGVTLKQQTVNLELGEPELQINVVMPVSAKKGSKSYDIKVVGPTATGPTTGLKPDKLTATMSVGGQTKALTLLEIGSGTYTFTDDFATVGTYTLLVEAEKAGYVKDSESFITEISDSGAVTASTAATAGTTSSTTTTTTTTGGTTGGAGDNNNLIIIAVVAGFIWWLTKKK